jgi:hypothetical protein
MGLKGEQKGSPFNGRLLLLTEIKANNHSQHRYQLSIDKIDIPFNGRNNCNANKKKHNEDSNVVPGGVLAVFHPGLLPSTKKGHTNPVALATRLSFVLN